MSTNDGSTVPLPDVLRAAIRPDTVRFVHANLSRNKRQPYDVSKRARHQTFAESWGTDRVVSRIPRNINQHRYVVVKALASFTVPTLVQSRGHRIDSVPEIRLVISDLVESIKKNLFCYQNPQAGQRLR
ncbi:60S ribosomal protein L4 [Platanthera guangdongensis]|uniref:60S ribosomal protein L4 n=1 Tax=Platanthera guangdongensis TaxID=2320717 RepID=A0ABR2LPI4_9ASPA